MKPYALKIVRFVRIALVAAAAVGFGWAGYKTAHYLRTAPRFEIRKLSVSGVKRVQENEVLAKAGFEVGTNVFRVRLDEIRERVEQLDWVRYALVQRVLPDAIMIKVVEREPIGLTRIQGEIYQFDIDAKILDPDPAAGAAFPILDGLKPGDRKNNRFKVEEYRRVLDALSDTLLSEVHVSESGEVTVVPASDPLLVDIGAGDFRNRWVRYLQLKSQIQEQYPQAVRVDLRFKNQIIIKIKDDDADEQIVWAGKKNTL